MYTTTIMGIECLEGQTMAREGSLIEQPLADLSDKLMAFDSNGNFAVIEPDGEYTMDYVGLSTAGRLIDKAGNPYRFFGLPRVNVKACHMNTIRHGLTRLYCTAVIEPVAPFAGDKKAEDKGPFVKHDQDKAPMQYPIAGFPRALLALAEVQGFGAKKYSPWNFKQHADEDRLFGALYRHLNAHHQGVTLDPETGKPHLAHALFNLMKLLEQYQEAEEKANDPA